MIDGVGINTDIGDQPLRSNHIHVTFSKAECRRLVRANATREASHNGMNGMFLLVNQVVRLSSLSSRTWDLASFTIPDE